MITAGYFSSACAIETQSTTMTTQKVRLMIRTAFLIVNVHFLCTQIHTTIKSIFKSFYQNEVEAF